MQTQDAFRESVLARIPAPGFILVSLGVGHSRANSDHTVNNVVPS